MREWVGTCTDFHEQKQAEEALREADRRKDEFLAILAHELRNPLAPVRNAAHYLKLQPLPDPELRRTVEVIERQVGQMGRLIDDLLDVSRISRGVMELRLERVEIGEVVQTAVDVCRDEVQSRSHTLRVTSPAQPPALLVDRARMVQVLCNLISNAAKYTPDGGRIEIRADGTADWMELSVRDNGIGIPAEMLHEIFDLFVQVDRSRERQGGLGIGLTLVRQLVGLHGGTIEARSAGPGRGSEFVLRLPIVAVAAAVAVAATPTPKPDDVARRILVAENNPDAVESLALLLRHKGHVVYQAFDGEEAVEVAKSVLPEVILLDIGMPKLDGYSVARRLREHEWGKRIFLVAVTGWGRDAERRLALESGFDAHLVKPVSPGGIDELLATVGPRPEDSIASG